MRNRIFCMFALLLYAVLLCTACAKPTPEPEPVPDTTLPPIDGPVYEGAEIAASPFVGSFRNTYNAQNASLAADVFPEEKNRPLLTCSADGSFTFVVFDIANETAHTIIGTFTVQDTVATFYVDDVGDVASLPAGILVVFTMTLLNENELRYKGVEMDCVSTGDLFARVVEEAPAE